jgi:hypothetical protein
MGASLNNDGNQTTYGYFANPGFSAHAQMLPLLEASTLYNSLNFNWGVNESNSSYSYWANSTGAFSQLKQFVCPSDPNAGQPDKNNTSNTNNYFCCVGTAMNFGNKDGSYTPTRRIGPRRSRRVKHQAIGGRRRWVATGRNGEI